MGITIRRAKKMARGMFRVGSTTSSLHWAMTSYPWKAMKVSPIALKTAPSPFGRNGWELPSHSGLPGFGRPPEVDVGEDEGGRHRERLLDGEVGDLRDVNAEPLEHVPEVGAEPEGVQAAGDGVGEP